MAKSSGHRSGAVSRRDTSLNPAVAMWTRRNTPTGQFRGNEPEPLSRRCWRWWPFCPLTRFPRRATGELTRPTSTTRPFPMPALAPPPGARTLRPSSGPPGWRARGRVGSGTPGTGTRGPWVTLRDSLRCSALTATNSPLNF